MLTEAEFETVKNYLTKAQILDAEVKSLNFILRQVVLRADPNDPLNAGATLAGLVAQFMPTYTAKKAVIVTKAGEL